MKFTPKSDEQLNQEQTERLNKFVLPAGTVVDYEIKEAMNKVSKAGNDMIEIHVDVYNDKGDAIGIRDWIGEWNIHKLKRICEANGMLDRYEAGQVDDYDLVGKTGKAKLGIQKGTQKEDGSFYADRNNIQEYMKPVEPVTKGEPELNDSIPF